MTTSIHKVEQHRSAVTGIEAMILLLVWRHTAFTVEDEFGPSV